MKLVLIAQHDNAGQHYLLGKALREQLGWETLNVIEKQSHLEYPYDAMVGNEEDHDKIKKAIDGADFFIFQDMKIDVGYEPLKEKVNPRNTVIFGTGSILRANIEQAIEDVKKGWCFIPPLSDPTLAKLIPTPPFENAMVDFERIDNARSKTSRSDPRDELVVCHATTKETHKGTPVWKEIMESWEERGVKFDVIQGVSYDEALARKTNAHVLLNSLGDRSYGISCLESLAMEQVVISNLDYWDYLLHPDLPMISTYRKEPKEVVDTVINSIRGANKVKRAEQRAETKKANYWVRTWFSPERQAQQWARYINHVACWIPWRAGGKEEMIEDGR